MILIGLLLSAAITHLWLSDIERFYVVDQQILKDPGFHQAGRHWQQKNSSIISYSGSTIHIENTERGSEEVTQRLLIETPVFVRFSLDAGGKNIVPEGKYWAGGSATLVYYDSLGSRFTHKNLLTLKRNSPIMSYGDVFYLDEKVDRIGVALRLLRAKGRFSVRNPELSVLGELPSYTKAKVAVVSYWVLVALALIVCLVKALSLKEYAWIGGLSFLVIGAVLVPGGKITTINARLLEVLPEFIVIGTREILTFFFGAVEAAAPSAGISKLGHFVVFLAIGFLVGTVFRRYGVLFGASVLAVFAVVTEALQILVHDRSTSLQDVSIDITGGVFGLLLGIALMQLLRYFGALR